ncbi:hypothetical protein ISN44_As10g010250 [Arabidopsis suecica]|uniref:Uncharacterized protein n=1 Tax=Arabidopsis suecica TaxID=45249 RepID=A0A8T1ZVF5_ARASU|nr:hypothetical protein ISN44_As10g010250 [Arabidopsis suecica]
MVVLKGGLSSGYKNRMTEKGSSSNGISCTYSTQDYCLAPKRGNIERSSFWFAIGGKQNFTSKKVSSETVRDSHLVSFSLNRENLSYIKMCACFNIILHVVTWRIADWPTKYPFIPDIRFGKWILRLEVCSRIPSSLVRGESMKSGNVLNILFNPNKFMASETHDPFRIRQVLVGNFVALGSIDLVNGVKPCVQLGKIAGQMDLVNRLNTDQSVLHDKDTISSRHFCGNVFFLQITIPFFVLHEEADIVTDPEITKALYEKASTFWCLSFNGPQLFGDQSSSGNLGPRQKAAALAALTSAFNSSSGNKLSGKKIGLVVNVDCFRIAEREAKYRSKSAQRKEEDQETAVRLASTMKNSLKGRPVQTRIFEGKVPPQFFALFQHMVVLKGGLSSGYKNRMTEKGSSKKPTRWNQLKWSQARKRGNRELILLASTWGKKELHYSLARRFPPRLSLVLLFLQQSFVQRYIVLAGFLSGLSPKVPLYEITEGNEPYFFTTYFSWYSTKATCKGIPSRRRQHYYLNQSRSGNQGPRQRAAALAALTSAYYSSSGKEDLRAEALCSLTSSCCVLDEKRGSWPNKYPLFLSTTSCCHHGVESASSAMFCSFPDGEWFLLDPFFKRLYGQLEQVGTLKLQFRNSQQMILLNVCCYRNRRKQNRDLKDQAKMSKTIKLKMLRTSMNLEDTLHEILQITMPFFVVHEKQIQ